VEKSQRNHQKLPQWNCLQIANHDQEHS
jgi:hypothetical protein